MPILQPVSSHVKGDDSPTPLSAYGDPPLTPDEAFADGLSAGLEGRFSHAPAGYTDALAGVWSVGYAAGSDQRWEEAWAWISAIDELRGEQECPEQENRGCWGGHTAFELEG